MKIYTASKTIHAHMWQSLRGRGYNVISTWIDEAGPGQSNDLPDLARRCIKEASECDVLVLYRDTATEILKGALIEAGAALAHGKAVCFVGSLGDMSTSAFRYLDGWYEFFDLEECLDFLKKYPESFKVP